MLREGAVQAGVGEGFLRAREGEGGELQAALVARPTSGGAQNFLRLIDVTAEANPFSDQLRHGTASGGTSQKFGGFRGELLRMGKEKNQ